MWIYIILIVVVLNNILWGSDIVERQRQEGPGGWNDIARAERNVRQAQFRATQVGEPLFKAHLLVIDSYKGLMDKLLREKGLPDILLAQIDLTIAEYEKLDERAEAEAPLWGGAGPRMREISCNNLLTMRETRSNPRTLSIIFTEGLYNVYLNQQIHYPKFPSLY